jgi:RNA-binding protein
MTVTDSKLTERQRRYLRGLAHPLKPIVMIGDAGLTDSVAKETERALQDHELIKVRVRGAEREQRDALLADLAQRTRSTLVNRIGHVAVLFRQRSKDSKIVIPDPEPPAD